MASAAERSKDGTPADEELIRSLERPGCDFPYYRGSPVSLNWPDWVIILAALAVGFALLIGVVPRPSFVGLDAYRPLAAVFFCGVPLAALAWRAGNGWTAIFNGFRLGYIGWGILFGILNLIFTAVIGMIAIQVLDLARNAAIAGLAGDGPSDGVGLFYLRTGIQLFGEEVITILPFLFLLWLGVQKLNLPRTGAIILAWIGSALLFAAIHLPTYDWHVAQALLLIGPVRLVLTLAYIKTRSIWTSTIAHVFNDWSMFTFTLLVAASGAASG